MAEYIEAPKEEDKGVKKNDGWNITISINIMRVVVLFFFALGFLLARFIYN